jgi:hypothetical protein
VIRQESTNGWFIIAGLIACSLDEHFRQVNPNWSSGLMWIPALLTASPFFVSLLLHELPLLPSMGSEARHVLIRIWPRIFLTKFANSRSDYDLIVRLLKCFQ